MQAAFLRCLGETAIMTMDTILVPIALASGLGAALIGVALIADLITTSIRKWR